MQQSHDIICRIAIVSSELLECVQWENSFDESLIRYHLEQLEIHIAQLKQNL